jgi:hypothetical protein
LTSLSPEQLDWAPELAILQALEVTLDIARVALFSANPQLQSDFIVDVPEPAVQVCLADAVILHLDGLRGALERYRLYLETADARARCTPARPKTIPVF